MGLPSIYVFFNFQFLSRQSEREKKNDILFYPALPALVVGRGRDNKKKGLAKVGFEPTTFGA